MNVTLRFFTRAVAGLIPIVVILSGSPLPAADAVAVFAKSELGLDLSRYRFGTAATNYPALLMPDPKVSAPEWRRMKIERPTSAGTNVTAFLDMRFEDDRLVELRTMFIDLLAPTNQNVQRLAAFQKLGAKPVKSNAGRFVLESKEWRMSAEGFCSNTNPMALQFNITSPSRGGLK